MTLEAMLQPAKWEWSWRRVTLLAIASLVLGVCQQALAQDLMKGSGPGRGGANCRPVSDQDNERTRDAGCWIMARVPQGEMSNSTVFWHVDNFQSLAEAEAVKGARGTVVQGLGKIWLFTIAKAGWQPSAGVRVAQIGPLHVKLGEKYTAQYMVAVFTPGMTTPVHRHPGPEAWYTLSGEVCLETPNGKLLGRAGENTIVPAGPPMKLTATGTEKRRSLVLILHETSQPSGFPVSDWTPKGLCK
jgi:quercetin dioxygenase-like cupin family protein